MLWLLSCAAVLSLSLTEFCSFGTSATGGMSVGLVTAIATLQLTEAVVMPAVVLVVIPVVMPAVVLVVIPVVMPAVVPVVISVVVPVVIPVVTPVVVPVVEVVT